MMVVITPTGGRQFQFAALTSYMMRQRYSGAVRWLVVDDVLPASVFYDVIQKQLPKNWDLVILRPSKLWEPGQNTQCRNMLLALGHVGRKDMVVIAEDDDWYAPTYLDTVEGWLRVSNLVGEGQARYYNVPCMKYRQLINVGHASLCSTAVKGDAVETLRQICGREEAWIDIALWNEVKGGVVHQNEGLVVGLKGLPGRSGLGMGHKLLDGVRDPDGSVLRQWIGDDCRRYLPIVH